MTLHQVFGFALALFSMALYGLYMAPRRKSAISQSTYTFWMGIGILLTAGAVGLILGGVRQATPFLLFLMLISGVIWATGTHAYCRAVQMIGLFRSTPIKNTSAMLGTVFGIIFLQEFSFSKPVPMVLALLGSLAVVLSATVLGRVEGNGVGADESSKGNRAFVTYGVLLSVWAAISYSVYTIPMKVAYQYGITPSQFLLYMGVGCFLGMVAIAVITREKYNLNEVTWSDRRLALLSGTMWALGSICANTAVKLIGVAITWPLTKTTLVAVLYGALVLGEVDLKSHRLALAKGVALSVAGVILLAVAMSLR